MMKNYFTNRHLMICLMALSSIMATADTLTLRNLFIEMPEEVIPYLTKTNRLDFIDFMDSNMKAEVTNELGGKSVMKALGNDSLSIRLNEACSIEMLLLDTTQPMDSARQVIALFRTFGWEGNIMETDLEFYTVKWRKLTDIPPLMPADERRIQESVKVSNILKLLKEKLNKE